MEKQNIKFKVGIIKGKIVFSEPEESENLPAVVPDPNIIFRVNGNEVTEKIFLNYEDIVELEPGEEIISSANFSISLSRDKLCAYLKVEPTLKKTFALYDQEPGDVLFILSREETVKEKEITREQVLQELKKQKISFGILEYNIDAALDTFPEEPVEIARGKPSKPGTDASVQIFFKQEFQTAPSINREGKVDYREILKIPYVEPGTTLAVKTPAVQGEPGITVTGEEVPVKTPRDIFMKADKTARLNTSGTEVKVKAVASGYPIVENKGNTYLFKVSNAYNHRGNVDLSTGNLRFQGDINIEGSVCEGMTVLAGGSIQINGDVNSAAVQSGEHLSVHKNVINSILRAGGIETLLLQMLPVIDSLKENICTLISTLEALKKHPKFKDKDLRGTVLLKLIRTLTKTKYPEIIEEVRAFKRLTSELSEHSLSFNLPPELLDSISRLGSDMSVLFDSNSEDFKDCEIMLTLLTYIKDDIKKIPVSESNITLDYSLNSRLETSGNVHITGQGSYQSKITAGGEIQVSGIVRGGSLQAGKDVHIKQIGSTAGIISHVKIPAKSKIHLKEVYENTCLTIGKLNYRFTMYQTNIEAYQKKGDIFLR
ncbi:MAG: hypothetical protein CVU88_04395 [Firmicutes bacterium HGW-Firmicutes-13]|nr:MAG: hypothetical protein CVU88_04395 [Firmicutes bacterium HGW-Firmicutes-13]